MNLLSGIKGPEQKWKEQRQQQQNHNK